MALVGWRRRIGVVAVQEVTEIEVGVGVWPGTDVDVKEVRRTVGESEVLEADLLSGFADGRLRRLLVGGDVTAREDPDAEQPVAVQVHAAAADDERRRGDVHRVGVLVERVVSRRSSAARTVSMHRSSRRPPEGGARTAATTPSRSM